MKKLLLIVPFVALAACEAPMSDDAGASSGPVSMTATGNSVQGSFASGTSRETVMASVRSACPSGSFSDFLEFPAEGGTTSFVASCS